MDVKTAIEKAGGMASVARACTDRGMAVSRQAVAKWSAGQRLPSSEWTGETSYARVICDLIKAMGHEDIDPIELCPGSGQYMNQPDSEAA